MVTVVSDNKISVDMYTNQLVCIDAKSLEQLLAADEESINSRFHTHQLELIGEVSKVACYAFDKSCCKEYDKAYQTLQRGIRLVSESKSKKLSKLLKISLFPSLAYYFYKNKKYSDALRITTNTIAIIDEYEYANRYVSIHCKKIEQLYNICRIHAKSDRPTYYVDASQQFYAYLLFGHLPLANVVWKNSALGDIPLGLRNYMLSNFHRETVQTSSLVLQNEVGKVFLAKLDQLVADYSLKIQAK